MSHSATPPIPAILKRVRATTVRWCLALACGGGVLCHGSARGAELDRGPTAPEATPAGWTAAVPAFDAAIEKLTNDQLIDRLPDLGMSRLNGPREAKRAVGFTYLDEWIDLSAPDSAIRIWSPELRELVRRGASALPALLEHVSDSRPTRLVFAVAHPRQPDAERAVTLTDAYDSRALPAKGGGGVNTGARVSARVEQGYAVKVGDLCFVAVGQIVNRRLFVFSYTDAGFDAHGRYKSGGVWGGRPFGFDFVNSPVATPALAAAVRADWHGLDARSLAQSLGADAAANRDAGGGLCRLLAYDPAAGTKAVHDAVQRVLAVPGEAQFWTIDQTLSTLSSFWWNDLATDLTALGRKAVRQDRRYKTFEDTRKNPLATGTAQVLATCGLRLVHRMDDTRLRSIVTEEIGRLRQQRAEYGGDVASVYDSDIGALQAIVRQLDGEAGPQASSPDELHPVPAPSTLKVTLDKTDTTGMRWTMIRLRFSVGGVSTSDMAAARVGITTAVDDTGFEMAAAGTPSFIHSAVGRVDDAVLSRNDPPVLDALLDAPPGVATRLVKLQGYVDIVVPGYDPAATVSVEHAAAVMDMPVVSPALAAAHVKVTVFDPKMCNDALAGATGAAGALKSYGVQPQFQGPPPKGAPPSLYRAPTITDSDIALGINDPEGRVVATEFVAPDGTALHYNHNGWYHASVSGGRRFDVYRLQRSDVANATLVLRLATGKALVRVPFDYRDVPLPATLH